MKTSIIQFKTAVSVKLGSYEKIRPQKQLNKASTMTKTILVKIRQENHFPADFCRKTRTYNTHIVVDGRYKKKITYKRNLSVFCTTHGAIIQ